MLDAYQPVGIVRHFLQTFLIMGDKGENKFGQYLANLGIDAVPGILTGSLGLINTGIQRRYNLLDREAEKQWWYEQQKYLEDHNSPAYRAMQMRKAGLNPYTEVSSTPLGNVDSSLPGTNAPHTFDVNAIQNSLLLNAQRENIEQDTELKSSQFGLNAEKIKTESEWRSNIIQQTLNLQQAYDLGLITESEAKLKFKEFQDAYNLGYNSYLIDWDLKESNRLLNESLSKLHEKQGQKVDQETLLTSVNYASATFELMLDKLFSQLEREADLKHISINSAFTEAEYEEFLDTQDVRQSLVNVQMAFSKLAVDEAERQDALAKIRNETDKEIAQQMLDAVKEGKGLDYWMLSMLQKDPSSFLHSMTNILSSFAPNVSYNRSSSVVVRKTTK